MDAHTVAWALGGEVCGGNQVLAPGPGHTPRDRSLSVRLDPTAPDGFLCHSFAGDNWRDCRDHVRGALGMSREERAARTLSADRQRRSTITETADALALWDRSTDAHGSEIESYLASRSLELPLGNSIIRRSWQFGPLNEPIVIMVALMRHVLTDQPVAVHRTYLDYTGTKIGRKVLGPSRNAAIKLAPAAEVLTVAEGLETGLAAMMAGMTSVWAMGSAGAIGALPVLHDVAQLVILAENDSGASQDAVLSCATRWRAAAKEVLVVVPRVGDDFAAVWEKVGGEWRKGVAIEQTTTIDERVVQPTPAAPTAALSVREHRGRKASSNE
jgi:putative DNA primase/helicase